MFSDLPFLFLSTNSVIIRTSGYVRVVLVFLSWKLRLLRTPPRTWIWRTLLRLRWRMRTVGASAGTGRTPSRRPRSPAAHAPGATHPPTWPPRHRACADGATTHRSGSHPHLQRSRGRSPREACPQQVGTFPWPRWCTRDMSRSVLKYQQISTSERACSIAQQI